MPKSKKNESRVAIKVENIQKNFERHGEKTSIKTAFVNLLKNKTAAQSEDFHVLKGVSFEVNEGDFFGIVGRNGSGKSTLLKIIAEIYKPTSGKVTVNGSLVPFIELGVGFNPELTGRENVFLNGALLGFSRKEMEEKYDEIVEFAELEDYMDEKLKNYSSGMQVRLAFSVAIRADGDILVLDEVLAVGDEAFQKKCQDYFYRLKKGGKTVILVTHSMESVRSFCNKAILINDGSVVASGNPDKVASRYSDLFIQEQIEELEKDMPVVEKRKTLSDVRLENVSILQAGKSTKAVNFKEDFSIKLSIKTVRAYEDLVMGVHVFDQAGRDMVVLSTKVLGGFRLEKGMNKVEFAIQNIFTDGSYYVNIAIEERASKRLLLQEHEISPFSIIGLNKTNYSKNSLTHPNITMHYDT